MLRCNSAILASIFLNEQLTKDGIIGCCLCFIGSLVIILHSPEEYALNSKEEVLKHALKPGALPFANDLCKLQILKQQKRLPCLFIPSHSHIRVFNLFCRATLWKKVHARLHHHLLPRRVNLRHGRQRTWRRFKINILWG